MYMYYKYKVPDYPFQCSSSNQAFVYHLNFQTMHTRGQIPLASSIGASAIIKKWVWSSLAKYALMIIIEPSFHNFSAYPPEQPKLEHTYTFSLSDASMQVHVHIPLHGCLYTIGIQLSI